VKPPDIAKCSYSNIAYSGIGFLGVIPTPRTKKAGINPAVKSKRRILYTV